MKFTSRLLEEAVHEFSKFPGIGKKSALRLVLHLLRQDASRISALSKIIGRLENEVQFCQHCFSASDHVECQICQSSGRDGSVICVVEDIKDLMAIENTGFFNGKYHVLGGLINPMDGVGPEDIKIPELLERVKKNGIQEIILALGATVEGDATIFYISKKLSHIPIKVTTISRGISMGGGLEFADEITLGRSITARIPV